MRYDELVSDALRKRLWGTPTLSTTLAGLKDRLPPAAKKIEGDLRTGIVDKIVDGDTILVDGIEIRLLGVDAPELGFPGSWDPVSTLKHLIFGREVLLDVRGTDPYGRLLAVVWVPLSPTLYLQVNGELLRRKQAMPYFVDEKEYLEFFPALDGEPIYGVLP